MSKISWWGGSTVLRREFWGGVLAPSLLLFVALFVLRHRMVTYLEIGYSEAWVLGVGRGWIQDAAVAFVPAFGAALFMAAFRVRLIVPWVLLAIPICGAGIANLLYFEYFGVGLQAWVIEQHLKDAWVIRDLIASLLWSPAFVAPAVAAVALLVGTSLLTRGGPIPFRRQGLLRSLAALTACAVFTVAALLLDPGYQLGGSAIAESPFFAVLKRDVAAVRNPVERLKTTSRMEAAQRDGLRHVVDDLRRGTVGVVGEPLARFRDWDLTRDAPSPATRGATHAWPMLSRMEPNAERTRALRSRLGIHPDEAPNVVVLFLETVRAYEVQHPEYGRAVFPEYWRVVDRHGIVFSQAYSSALSVGLTVRGQLSSLCSMFPNFEAAATYVAHPSLRIRCLGDLAAEQGYDTLWLSGGPKEFHNKFIFESLHGFSSFFDYEYFKRFPFEAPFQDCGYPDKPFLNRGVDVLRHHGRGDRPFLASLLTLSTHPPHTRVPEAPVPQATLEFLRSGLYWDNSLLRELYVRYLSRLRYMDQALGEFFDALFESELGDRTVVFILGDHAAGIRTPFFMTPPQRIEMRSRVPFAIVTKHMPEPRTVDAPVHQIDLAPTIAAIAGLHGQVTWIGRPLLDGPGSPWLFSGHGALHYRVGERACYTLPGGDAPSCFRIPAGRDPLFELELQTVAALPEQARFFAEVVDDTRRAIGRNRIAPAGHSQGEAAP